MKYTVSLQRTKANMQAVLIVLLACFIALAKAVDGLPRNASSPLSSCAVILAVALELRCCSLALYRLLFSFSCCPIAVAASPVDSSLSLFPPLPSLLASADLSVRLYCGNIQRAAQSLGETLCGVDRYTLQVAAVREGLRASRNHAFCITE